MRESFRFFKTFLDTGKALPSAELQAQFFIALAEYALEGKEPEDPMLQALLVAPKFTIDKSEAISASASERGKLGGRPKKSFGTTQKAPKANESYGKLSKATESEVEVEEEIEVENKTFSNEKEKKNKNNKKINYSSSFELFWKAYPKRKGKQEARKAWENAIKAGVSEELMIKKAGDYATEIRLKKTQDSYIKRPQGWLNEGRYDDDYDVGFTGAKPDLDDVY